jgi:hypothetical protein
VPIDDRNLLRAVGVSSPREPTAVLLFYGQTGSGDKRIFTVPADDSSPIPGSARNVILLVDNAPDIHYIVTQRRVDLGGLFREGGRLILLFGPRASQGWGKQLGDWLSDTLQLSFSPGELDVHSRQPRLDRYLHQQTAFGALARRKLNLPLEPLAVGGGGKVVAAQFQHERADVFLLPLRTTQDIVASALTLLELLPDAGGEYPRYLDAFPLADETALRNEYEDLSARSEAIQSELATLERAKGILHKTDLELQSEVVRFLNDHLGIPSRPESSNREDFWLLADGEEAVIGEVKGPGKQNVSKGDVGALMFHRTKAIEELLPEADADSFPGLLVVSTLHRKKRLEERDVPPPDDVMALAAANAILIMRTLDLVRVLDLRLRKLPEPDILAEAQSSGGWLEVNLAAEWNHHT